MPAFTATAPGKIILAGEHAVVYDQPALAVPLSEIRARAIVQAAVDQHPPAISVTASQIGLQDTLAHLSPDHPLKIVIEGVFNAQDIPQPPAMKIQIHSTIPISAGLGSGAAVSVAVIRALSGFLGHPLPQEKVSEIAYQAEKIHHGSPSGIDNTVITYQQPVYFTRGKQFETFSIAQPLTLIIADTGIPSSTADAVEAVRRGWKKEPERYQGIFTEIGDLVRELKLALEEGDLSPLGQMLTRNHQLLRSLKVSSPELDRLVDTALSAGAQGAKLSGGGRGGNMLALVNKSRTEEINHQLLEAGAARTLITEIGGKD